MSTPRQRDPQGAGQNWQDALVWKKGKTPELKACLANASSILSHHPRWQGVIGYNEFCERVDTLTSPPWYEHDAPKASPAGPWTDSDTARVVAWLSREYKIDLSPSSAYAAVDLAAKLRPFHPVRRFLRGLKWDKQPRCDLLLSNYFGTADTPYTRAVGSKFLLSAVARVMRPGCKVDTMPILEGSQGGFKSTGIRFLAGDDWYCTITGDLVSKDTLQSHNGKWIAELDELGSLLRTSTQEQVKSYFSRCVDRYRPPYGKIPRDYPRQVVTCGTTNRWQYLTDETGARRQWPVRCERACDISAIVRDREQIWAEAYARFAKGEPWHVPRENADLLAEFEREQDDRFQEHPWTERIERWLMDPAASVRRTLGVTVGAVLSECMALTARDQGTREATIVSAILRRLKWKPGARTRDGRARVTRWQPETMPTAVEAPSGVRPTVEPPAGEQGSFFDLDDDRDVGQ